MRLGLSLTAGLLLLLGGLSLWGTISARRVHERTEARQQVTEALSGNAGPERVADLFRQARSLDPVYAACEEGARLEAQGLFAEAAESFHRCLEGDPELLAARVAWAEARLRAHGQPAYEEVVPHLRLALEEARSAGQTDAAEIQRAEDLLLDIEALLLDDSPAGLPADWTAEDLVAILTRPDIRGLSRYAGPRAVLRLRFRPDDAYLGAEAREDLGRVALALKHTDLADAIIQIEGHTDNQEGGTKARRKVLARQRAEAAWGYLVRNQGVSPKRLRIAGFGDHYPLSSNETAQGRDENRRVELVNLETKAPLLRDARRR